MQFNDENTHETMNSQQDKFTSNVCGFLSFTNSDRELANSFKINLNRRFPQLHILEHPVRKVYEKDWKSHCELKINNSSFLICLVGNFTHSSRAVEWEVNRGLALGKQVIAINLIDKLPLIPNFLKVHSIEPIKGKIEEVLTQINGDYIFNLTK